MRDHGASTRLAPTLCAALQLIPMRKNLSLPHPEQPALPPPVRRKLARRRPARASAEAIEAGRPPERKKLARKRLRLRVATAAKSA